MSREEIPLATIFREVFTFLSGRTDVVVFGAHAVNAYAEPERMTQDVDLLSTRAREVAEEVREHLAKRLTIAARATSGTAVPPVAAVREVVQDTGFRVYQLRTPKNRHLVDLRQVVALPAFREVEGVRVVAPIDLVVMKVLSAAHRRGAEKGLSDRLDTHRLLHAFPELRAQDGEVSARLVEMSAGADVLSLWREIAGETLTTDDDDS